MKYRANKLIWFLDILLLAAFVAADQFSKYAAVKYLKTSDAVILLKDIIQLQYLENRGAAFGMLQNNQWFFLLVGCVFVIAASVMLIYIPTFTHYHALRIAIIMITAGAVGNMIDRVLYNYVVDFIYFIYINFPIFNVADIFVTVGCALIILLILFYYKDDELDFKKARILKVHSSMKNPEE